MMNDELRIVSDELWENSPQHSYSAFIFGWKASYASLVVLIITFTDYKSNIFLLIANIDFYLY
ncbi:serine/threonine protein kinase [Nostoc cycadae WK-1]|uniref:Serine/threonine protein kinase n=1 Tax=Nostoc cycadae WK-1 TaxID=1861711 RepID=A0A2H6LHR9_9NOSO|nr:serine/threonine protein kinase [Nostoc cycadae WK-1]